MLAVFALKGQHSIAVGNAHGNAPSFVPALKGPHRLASVALSGPETHSAGTVGVAHGY